jgi:hypothetical protein
MLPTRKAPPDEVSVGCCSDRQPVSHPVRDSASDVLRDDARSCNRTAGASRHSARDRICARVVMKGRYGFVTACVREGWPATAASGSTWWLLRTRRGRLYRATPVIALPTEQQLAAWPRRRLPCSSRGEVCRDLQGETRSCVGASMEGRRSGGALTPPANRVPVTPTALRLGR